MPFPFFKNKEKELDPLDPIELKEISHKEIPSREITFTKELPAEIGAKVFDLSGYRTLSQMKRVCFGWDQLIKNNKNFREKDDNPFINQIKVVLTRYNHLEKREDSKVITEKCKPIINKFKKNFDEIFEGNNEDKYRLIRYICKQNEKINPKCGFEINEFLQALMKVLQTTFKITPENIRKGSPWESKNGGHNESRISSLQVKRKDIGLLKLLIQEYKTHPASKQEVSDEQKESTPAKSL